MVSNYRRKRFYPTAARILVHMSTSPEESDSGLRFLTQEGIASATGSARPTATKWLGRLERKGLVCRVREHVPGHRIRKEVYRLSSAGWDEVGRLRRRLESETVEVITPTGVKATLRVADVPRYFPRLLDLRTTVSIVSGGMIDLRGRPPVSMQKDRQDRQVWGDRTLKTDRFFGRSSEFETLKMWMRSPSRLLAVVGLPGIGKSALVSAWIARTTPRNPVYWTEIQASTSVASLLADLGLFLADHGRRSLIAHLRTGGGSDLSLAKRVLVSELQRLTCLVVFDNLDRAAADLTGVLREVVRELAGGTGTKFIVVSRSVPGFLAGEGRQAALAAQVLRLKGLDVSASLRMLEARGIPESDSAAARIAAAARGHPLLLALSAHAPIREFQSWRQFFYQGILRTLSGPERRLLEAAAILRRPMLARDLASVASAEDSIVSTLESRDLLQPTTSGGLLVHDLLRGILQQRVSRKRMQLLHGRAARYYLRRTEPRERLEGMYHLLWSGQLGALADLIDADGSRLLDSMLVQEVATLFATGVPASHHRMTNAVTSEFLGDCLRIQGHLRPSLYRYRSAIGLCASGANEGRIPRLLRKIASVERQTNRFPQALGHLIEAEGRLAAFPDSREMAEVLRERSLVEMAQGATASAEESLSRAIDYATEVSDAGSLSASLLVLGTLEAGRGNRQRGLLLKKEGLRIAERAGNITESARANISLGLACQELGAFAEALSYHERGLQLARLLGNLRLIAYATLNRAAVLLDLAQPDEARSPLHEARELFGILDERDALATLDINEGQLALLLGDWSRAERLWHRGLSALRSSGSPSDLLRSLTAVAKFHRSHGETAAAQVLLKEALSVARGLGDTASVKEIQSELRPSAKPLQVTAGSN